MDTNNEFQFFSGNFDLFETPVEPYINPYNNDIFDLSGPLLEEDLFQSQTLSTDEKHLEVQEYKKTTIVEISENSDFIESLEQLVRREIKDKGIEAVVKHCAEHHTKQCFVRDRSDKTERQVKAMVDALDHGKTQLPKGKRVKLGKQIGLSESQIYKW
eukprot:CAMPEP_0205814524 /NCGR_PEP_ID=MMETSP0205-20121125/19734_1 /ASSEMBLY_ACC=CAM_ASM_000278 /TAXON_ID=36767 /ORGANISM="Euplotes focardii, Strain TN1" /LENGTH=157 /DNA_ID=CAMNT_0053098801 /DNA_START=13 /DNA_END=483 /DNA_ORIENTATION=+